MIDRRWSPALLRLVLLMIAVCLLDARPVTAAGDACEGITPEVLQRHMTLPSGAKILSQRDIMGLCEVILQGGDQVTTLYATKDYVMKGMLYASQRQLTQEQLNALQAAAFRKARPALDEAVAFTYRPAGAIHHTVYMFSSPFCPHCSQALSQIKPILDATQSELKVLLCGSGDARLNAIEAVCRKVDLDTYNAKTWQTKEGPKVTCAAGIQAVDQATALSRELQVTGLPTFFLESGQAIRGAKLPVLEQALQH